jgi:hypothetical protein
MSRKLVIALLALLIPAGALADYAAGVKAFDSGDFSTAHAQWLAAANQGDESSLFRLGQLYEQGVGVPQNFEQAHFYYNLAGAFGSADARQARDALAANMTAEQVARSQDKAAAWRPAEPVTGGTASTTVASISPQAAGLSWSGVNKASVAVLGDEVQTLNRLLAGGTDPNVRLGNGDTLLLQAVRNSSLATVQALLAAGADPDMRDPGGWTPLKAAIYGNRTDVARVLLRAGADPADPSPDGLTALALAQRLGQADMMVLLSR